ETENSWRADADDPAGGAERDRLSVGRRFVVVAEANEDDVAKVRGHNSLPHALERVGAAAVLRTKMCSVHKPRAPRSHVEARRIGGVGHKIQLVLSEANTRTVI